MDIKQYSLSEIGVFLRTTVQLQRTNDISELYNRWYSHHLSQKGLVQVANSMKQTITKTDNMTEKGELSKDFIKNERKDFKQAFMSLNAGRRRVK